MSKVLNALAVAISGRMTSNDVLVSETDART
jgi:hypothetical protein